MNPTPVWASVNLNVAEVRFVGFAGVGGTIVGVGGTIAHEKLVAFDVWEPDTACTPKVWFPCVNPL